jgi:hypothetical protein
MVSTAVVRLTDINPRGAEVSETAFIVQIKSGSFFAGLEGDDPSSHVKTTDYPSQAVHLRYKMADDLCGFLISRGHDAVVCNIYGRPMNVKLLAARKLHQALAEVLPPEETSMAQMLTEESAANLFSFLGKP